MLIFPTIEREKDVDATTPEKDDRDLDAAFSFAADDDADAPTTTRELECPIANICWSSSSSSAR